MNDSSASYGAMWLLGALMQLAHGAAFGGPTERATVVDVHSGKIPLELCPFETAHEIRHDEAFEARMRRANSHTTFVLPSGYWVLHCRNVVLHRDAISRLHYSLQRRTAASMPFVERPT